MAWVQAALDVAQQPRCGGRGERPPEVQRFRRLTVLQGGDAPGQLVRHGTDVQVARYAGGQLCAGQFLEVEQLAGLDVLGSGLEAGQLAPAPEDPVGEGQVDRRQVIGVDGPEH